MSYTNKAQIVGIEQILQWFETNAKQPFFSVWISPKIITFQNTSNDMDEAVELLTKNLEAAKQNNFYQNLTLKLHYFKDKDIDADTNESPIITNNTPFYGSLVFKVMEYVAGMEFTNASSPRYYTQQQQPQQQQTQQLEWEDEDEDEEEEPQKETIGSIVAGIAYQLIKEPQIQQALITMGANLLSKFTGVGKQQPLAINGVPNNINNTMTENELQQAIEALQILKKHRAEIVSDLITLANIAQTDPPKANFILSMLPR